MPRERGEYKRKTRKGERVYRAGAGSGCQALRNSWSICPCSWPVCNKKGAEGEKGLDRAGGKQQIADASIGEGSL